MNTSISFSKLPSGRGWGVRYATKGQHPSPGDTILVNKRSGGTSRVTLGGVYDRDPGAFPGPANYYYIVPKHRTANPQPGLVVGATHGDHKAAQRVAAARHPEVNSANVTVVLDRSATLAGDLAAAEQTLREAWDAVRSYDPADHEYFDGEDGIQWAHEGRLLRKLSEARKRVAELRDERYPSWRA